MHPIDLLPRRRFITVTPLGSVFLIARGRYLEGCYFLSSRTFPEDMGIWAHPTDPVLEPAALQIREYMAGTRQEFSIPLRAEGNDFCQRVWVRIAQIPDGATATYGQLAASLGNRHMARAVGQAVGMNPLSIVVPCHRVVAANGGLGGYIAGPEVKRALLDLEACHRGTPEDVPVEGQDQLF